MAITQPTWSYSAIKGFDTCPKQHYHLSVKKDYAWPKDASQDYGTEFHKAAEQYIKYSTPLDKRFGFAKPLLVKLNKMKGEKLCEFKMGLTAELEPCEFFAKDVWFRTIIDLAILNGEEAKILDYKTGKSAQYADKGQLELMALATFKHFPQIKVVRGGLLFVVANAFVKETYEIDRESDLWAKWLGEYKKLVAAHKNNVWNPKPSGLCKAHCAILECEHNGRA